MVNYNSLYNNIVENCNDGIVIVQDYLTKFINPRMTKLTGYALKDIEGEQFLSFIAPEFVDLVKQNYEKRVTKKEVPERYRIEVIKKNGQRVFVEISGSVVDYEGKPADMIFLRDITEQQKNEKELIQYKFIFEKSHQQVALADLNGNFILANNAWAEGHGYKLEEIIGKNLRMFHRKEDLPSVDEFIEKMIKNGQHCGEIIHMKKDGSTFFSWMDNFVLELSGKKYLVGMASDITEEKEFQKEIIRQKSLLDSIITSLEDAVLVIDREGKVVFYNDKFKKFWKIPEELINKKDDQRLLDYVVDQLFDPKDFIKKVEYLYVHPEEESSDVIYFKDGRVFNRNSAPQKSGENIVGRVWVFTDVTEKNRALVEEKKRVNQIEKMNKIMMDRELKMAELKNKIKELGGKI